MCTSSTTSENRHFYVVVVQRRLRNVQKSVIHVQSSCFANLNLLLFCRSRFRYRRPCLGSQLKTPWGLRVNAFHSNSLKHWKFRSGILGKNRRERGVGSFCFVCHFFFGLGRVSGRFKSEIASKHFASEIKFVELTNVRKLKLL